jgi:RNA polymerase sigma-70 factor (ECF subfamily)
MMKTEYEVAADADGIVSAGSTGDLPGSRTTGVADMEQLYIRFVDRIYRFLYARVGNREDANDLTSETFLKAARLVDFDRSEASITAWLFTVARTVLADHWRRHYRAAPHVALEDDHVEIAAVIAPSQTHQNETESRVEAILAGLPERDRRVLELRFLRGYTILETAQELGVTADHAKVLQHRALAKAARLQTEDTLDTVAHCLNPPCPPSRLTPAA